MNLRLFLVILCTVLVSSFSYSQYNPDQTIMVGRNTRHMSLEKTLPTPVTMKDMFAQDTILDDMSKEFAQAVDSCMRVSPVRLEKVYLAIEFRDSATYVVRHTARMAESDSSFADLGFFYARTDSYATWPEPGYTSDESHEQVHEMTLPRPVKWQGRDALQLTIAGTASNYTNNVMVRVEEDFFLLRKN